MPAPAAAARAGTVDPATFWAEDWAEALEQNGARGAADADLLGLEPLTIAVDGDARTLRIGPHGLEAVTGESADRRVALDADAFRDLVHEERTAIGLVIGGRVDGRRPGPRAVLCLGSGAALRARRSPLYRPGDVVVQAPDGTDLDLDQRFGLDDQDAAAEFLAEAGFLLLTGVFTEAEMADLDADLAAAVDEATLDDGASWWAATRRRRALSVSDPGPLRPVRAPPLVDGRSPVPGHRPDPRRRPRAGRSLRRALQRTDRRGPAEAGRLGGGPGLPALAQGLRARSATRCSAAASPSGSA